MKAEQEIVPETGKDAANAAGRAAWIDVLQLARIEVTSEDDLFPVTHALGHTPSVGWRAAHPGQQVVRLLFHAPQTIRRIWLDINDRVSERSQEISVHAGAETDTLREVVRQQFHFSPAGSTAENEDYQVDLQGVTVIELRVDPDRSHEAAQSQMYAVLTSFWLA